MSGPLCDMQQRSRMRQSWGLLDCLRSPGGATGVLTHLEVWAPNMFPSEAEPLPPAAFHPPAWPEDLLDPPPAAPETAREGALKTESHQILLGSPRP